MIRTRFAPSPTGMIHIGNLRTALYSYLIAKHNNGQFILRIEDTDKERSKQEYTEYIYKALNQLGLEFDESPFNPNKLYEPYIQSERVKNGLYLKYAKQLIEQGDAYYCFCPEAKTDLDTFKDECHYQTGIGYDKHCRYLSKEEIEENLKNNKPYVIRQKIPDNIDIKYHDEVYGDIIVNSKSCDDQVLIKRDGYPTYNFANVIDDHLMNITHIVRGNEYISSTPKYVLLYKSFNWEIPKFIHLPLIYIIDENGQEQKMSKRFNCSSFENLIQKGYLPEAIINYIVKLGWNNSSNREIYSLKDLENIFEINDIGHTDKVLFDEEKLNWFNHEYIIKLPDDEFISYCKKYSHINIADWNKIIPHIKDKIKHFSEIDENISYIENVKPYLYQLFFDYKKNNYNDENILNFINYINNNIHDNMNSDDFYNMIKEYSNISKINFGSLMHIYRIIVCGLKNVMISATYVSEIISLDEIKSRLEIAKNIIQKKI